MIRAGTPYPMLGRETSKESDNPLDDGYTVTKHLLLGIYKHSKHLTCL